MLFKEHDLLNLTTAAFKVDQIRLAVFVGEGEKLMPSTLKLSRGKLDECVKRV